jgi:hypothetical protein
MSLTKTAINSVGGVGVFTRGYPDQLEEACQRDPDALTTFRSKKTWRAVENALNWRDDEITVYFVRLERIKSTIRQCYMDCCLILNQKQNEQRSF